MLHFSYIGSDSAAQCALVLHGIYGSGGNWRTVARKLTERRPDWGAVLVDLRMHGRSQGMAPPHTVAAAAADLADLAATLERPVRAVIGHSFGGKVTLAYARDHGASLAQAWILDSSPSARPGALEEPGNSVVAVLELLEGLPASFADRDEFVDYVMARGQAKMLASWLAMNLEPVGGRFRFRLDPSAVRALLTDYYATDLWEVVESPPCPLRFVVAGRGSALSADDSARLQQLAGERVGVDLLADAGHWLHIDALEPLLELLVAGLPA